MRTWQRENTRRNILEAKFHDNVVSATLRIT